MKPHPGIVEAEVGRNVETSTGDLGITSVLQTGTASCINIYMYLSKPSNCSENYTFSQTNNLISIVQELTPIKSYNQIYLFTITHLSIKGTTLH